MRTQFLCGHGNWDPNDGFINLPKGCSMTFYTHHAKTMLQDAVLQIVAGTYAGEPHQVASQFMAVPNMRLSPDDAENKLDTRNALATNPLPNASVWFVNQVVTLKTLFGHGPTMNRIRQWVTEYGGVDFHWTCCRYVDMPKMSYRLTPGGTVLSATAGQGSVKGKHGFNASEDLVDDVYLYRDRTDNDKVIKTVPR